MSKISEATAQRLVSAVRRIARESLLEDGSLGPAAGKPRIGKTRGVAYYNANGDIESGSEVPDEAATDSAAEDGTGRTGSSTKSADYAKINKADDAEVGDTFDQFEGYDCTTGDKITVDLTPLEGAEYVPPDGWEDANTPPGEPYFEDDGTWENGYFYLIEGHYGPTKSDLCSSLGGHLELYDTKCQIGSWLAPINRMSCGSGVPAAAMCGISPGEINPDSVATAWPSNNTAQLILKDGKFQANDYDPDADAYKASPPAELEMCDGQGNRYSVTALDGGSTMLTKLDAGGSPTADGRSLIIDSSGVVKQRVPNSWRDGYL